MNVYELGASLYVPTTRADLAAVGVAPARRLRSVILCTEDAVAEPDVAAGLRNLEAALPRLAPGPARFVRPRSPKVLERVLEMPGVQQLAGFVLPKITARRLGEWLAPLQGTGFRLMPTLETAEVFEATELRRLRRALDRDGLRERVLALRVGGTDLMSALGLRRPAHRTIYETVLAPVLSGIVTTFRPAGFGLTAPVFEGLAQPSVLRAEAEQDLAWGFTGKTAVHPDQVPLIEGAWVVDPRDYAMAAEILDPSAPAVFRMADTMCEVATHRRWAASVLTRAAIYGVRDGRPAATELDAPN